MEKFVKTPEQEQQEQMVKEIANNISSLAKSVQTLLGGKLKRKAIIILLAQSAGMYQNEVDRVLVALENLEKNFTN